MALLLTGIIIFIGIHSLPWHTTLRTGLINKIGLNPYKGLFSLFAFAGLILMIYGKANAEYQFIWAPPSWGRTLAYPLMFIALLLMPAANLPTNIKCYTRHPMLWAIVLWSIAHLAANDDLASVILFGAMGLYALLAMLSANKRGASKQSNRVAIKYDALVITIGLTANIGFLMLHPYLFGVAVI